MTSFERSGATALRYTRIANIGYFVSLGLLILAMTGNFYNSLVYLYDAIFYPFGLDYGEGIVWQQMTALKNGTMYSSVHEFPFLVFHYTPIFHAVALFTSELFGNSLASGRAISVLSTLGSALLIGIIVQQVSGRETSRATRFLGPITAFLVVFTFLNLSKWAPLMRVDMLAIMLDLAGVALFIASLKHPRLFYFAALVFVLAVFTKQNTISGAFACFLISLLIRFNFTLRVLALAVVVGGGALVGLTILTEGNFVRHIFLYNVNRLDWNKLDLLSKFGLSSSIALEIAVVGVYLVARRIVMPRPIVSLNAWRLTLRHDPAAAAKATLLTYLAIVLLLSASILKSGAYLNYLIPLAGVAAIMFGFAISELTHRISLGDGRSLDTRVTAIITFMFVCFTYQILNGPLRLMALYPPEETRVVEQVLERVAKVPGPVWSDDMVLAKLAGKDVIAEPAILTELAVKGVWDQGPFIKMIRERKFDLVVINSLNRFDGILRRSDAPEFRFTRDMVTAIDSAYPVVETIGNYRLYYPAPRDRK